MEASSITHRRSRPVPLDAFLESLVGHLLDLVEHADQLHPVLGFEWRQRQGAVAGHDGGHAVGKRRFGVAVPEQLRVEVGMRIDALEDLRRRDLGNRLLSEPGERILFEPS